MKKRGREYAHFLIEAIVPGRPMPWERVIPNSRLVAPKFGKRGFRFVAGAHVPKKTREYEDNCNFLVLAAMKDAGMETPITDPVFLAAVFGVPRERESHRNGRLRVLHADESYEWPVRRGDGDSDNYLKALKDGLSNHRFPETERVLRDDSLVVAVTGMKVWAGPDRPEGFTRVRIFSEYARFARALPMDLTLLNAPLMARWEGD